MKKYKSSSEVKRLKAKVVKYLKNTGCVLNGKKAAFELVERLSRITSKIEGKKDSSKKMKSCKLTKKEIVQIVNLGPQSAAELFLIVDDYENRFTIEIAEEILELVTEYLHKENREEDEHEEEAKD